MAPTLPALYFAAYLGHHLHGCLSDSPCGGSALPLPWHLGFPMSLPAEGVVSVVRSPQLIFH